MTQNLIVTKYINISNAPYTEKDQFCKLLEDLQLNIYGHLSIKHTMKANTNADYDSIQNFLPQL